MSGRSRRHLRALEGRNVVGVDFESAGDVAVEEIFQGFDGGSVGVSDDGFGAGAVAGLLGDLLADEGVDEGAFADVFAADEADEVEGVGVKVQRRGWGRRWK